MMAPDDKENATFAHTRADMVTKPDGRYLIYYAWPNLDDEQEGADPDTEPSSSSGDYSRGPDQQPWSPQGGPPDE